MFLLIVKYVDPVDFAGEEGWSVLKAHISASRPDLADEKERQFQLSAFESSECLQSLLKVGNSVIEICMGPCGDPVVVIGPAELHD
jgi:hypothetical protein